MNNELRPYLIASIQALGDARWVTRTGGENSIMTQTHTNQPLVSKYKTIRNECLQRLRAAGYFVKYLEMRDALDMPMVLISKIRC